MGDKLLEIQDSWHKYLTQLKMKQIGSCNNKI